MAQVIKLKRGNGTPTTSNITNGEVAIDLSGRKLYVNDNGTVKEIGGGTTITAPNAPSITSTASVGETIEVVFNASSTSNIGRYEVYSSVNGGDYGLIATITPNDFASTMTVVDASFSTTGVSIAYRVYAVKNGVYSSAATASRTYTTPSLDVSNLSVIPETNAFHIQYEFPDSRFVDHIEIYKDAETTLGALSRTGASLIYSGDATSYVYNIATADLAKYHQFWVEVVTS